MGRFANASDEFVGMWIGPKPVATGQVYHGFEAFGQIVPFNRRQEGYEHLKQMGFTDKEQMFRMVQMLADRIQRDNIWEGMEELYKMGLDVTGIYRLIAVMCSDPPQVREQNVVEASYVDLYPELNS